MIKTKDFVLRSITLSKKDIQGYLECHLDKDAQRNFTNAPRTLTEAKSEIKKNMILPHYLAVEIDGRFAGFVHLELNKNPKYKHSAVIGFGLHKDFRGRGLGTKVVKTATNYGFRKLKLVRISGLCRPFNKASIRVLEKSGYKLEGVLKKSKFINGKYLDDMIWAKVR